jgi:ACS family sodium-dependent inorganic phosphate cotransporter
MGGGLQAYSSPAEDPSITEEEKNIIMGDSEPEAPVKDIPWKLLLSKAPVWVLIICHFCHNWGTFILLTWMPTYYNQVSYIMSLILDFGF